MWIRTQNKQRIINSDQIVDIYINNRGTAIYAESVFDSENSYFVLGEFKDRDTCMNILEMLMAILGHDNIKWINIPLGGEVEEWIEKSGNVLGKLYTKFF